MDNIRAFIAIELSEEARAVLGHVTQQLAASTEYDAVKWVNPDRMHLTLRFLGETPLAQLDELGRALDGVALQHQPFELFLDALGCFPHEGRPRVIWVGVKGQVAETRQLRAAVESAIEPLGWQPDRKSFEPHLTLGRVKNPRASIRLPWGQGIAPARTLVHELVLFESQLRREGARYIARHTSALGSG